MQKEVHGHIDCPTCGLADSMRITHDKNNDPFGFCEAGCGQQMRIGGNAHRVRQFLKRYPWAAGKAAAAPKADKKPEPAPEPIQPEKTPPASITPAAAALPPAPEDTHHGPVRKRSAFEDAVAMLGGGRK